MKRHTGGARLEDIQRATITVMSFLNRNDAIPDLIRNICEFLKDWLGCDALGIRLQDGEDFPYYESRGFPEEFLLLETSLCARDHTGTVLRDSEGKTIIECMCGNIILGRVDPSLPFFTRNGSFLSNCTSELLASTTDGDRQTRTRNRCNGMGYESVGLFPMRLGDVPFGLVQVNHHARDFFSPDILEFLERITNAIVIGIAQRQAKEKLESSLEEKEALLREVHHRVKNNLQIVSGFLYLASEQTENGEVLRIIGDARDRIEVMSLIHTQLYRSKNLVNIAMDAHIREIVEHLSQIYLKGRGKITCRVEVEPIELPLSQAIPCGLLLNELISNALKHAFSGRDEGFVSIAMTMEHGIITMSVRDDGVGVPAGFDLKTAKSLGLSLARNLMEGQLKGDLAVSRANGTLCTASFRKAPE